MYKPLNVHIVYLFTEAGRALGGHRADLGHRPVAEAAPGFQRAKAFPHCTGPRSLPVADLDRSG